MGNLDKLETIVQAFASSVGVIPDRQAVVDGGKDKTPWILPDNGGWIAVVMEDDAPLPSGYEGTSIILPFWYPTVTSGGNIEKTSTNYAGWNGTHTYTVITKRPSYKFFMGYQPNPNFLDPNSAWGQFKDNSTEPFNQIVFSGENDQVSPRSLIEAADQLHAFEDLMNRWQMRINLSANNIDVPGGKFQGSAAGVFKAQLLAFSDRLKTISEKLAENKIEENLRYSSIVLRAAMRRLLNTIEAWQMSSFNSPAGAMQNLWLTEIALPLANGEHWDAPDWGTFKKDDYKTSPVAHIPGYGNPTTQGFWDAFQAKAHTKWLERVNLLDTFLAPVPTSLDQAYIDTYQTFHVRLPQGSIGGGTAGGGSGDTDDQLDKFKDDAEKQIAKAQEQADKIKEDAQKQIDEANARHQKLEDDIQKRAEEQIAANNARNAKEMEALKDQTDADNARMMAGMNQRDQQAADAALAAQKQADEAQKRAQGQADDAQRQALQASDEANQRAEQAVGKANQQGNDAAEQAAVINQRAQDEIAAAQQQNQEQIAAINEEAQKQIDSITGEGETGVGSAGLPPGSTLGADGTVIGPDGLPVEMAAGSTLTRLAPVGESLGGLKSPITQSGATDDAVEQVIDADGQPIRGADGQPITVPPGSVLNQDGTITGPDGQPITGENGQALTMPPGSSLVPTSTVTGPDGQIVADSSGQPLQIPNNASIGADGNLVGANGQPIVGADGQPLTVDDGSTLTSPAGSNGSIEEVIGANGQPVLDGGQPITVPPGSVLNADGTITGPDGQTVTGADGQALHVPAGSELVPTGTNTGADTGTNSQVFTDSSGVQLPVDTINTPGGQLVTDASGNALNVPTGSTINPDGTITAPDGQLLTDADGQPITVPPGSTVGSGLIQPTFSESALTGADSGAFGSGDGTGVAGGASGFGGAGLGSGLGAGAGSGSGVKSPTGGTEIAQPKVGASAEGARSNLGAAELAAQQSQLMNRVATSGGSASEGQMMPPMTGGGAGAGGGGGGSQGSRKTWVTEDEEVWGTETETTVGVLGR